MTNLTSAAERRTVAQIAKEIEAARVSASAEVAFSAIRERPNNPWAGACERLRDLEHERSEAIARAKGEQLAAAIDELAALDAELLQRAEERKDAEAALARGNEDPTAQRWQRAKQVAISYGLAHALELVTPWLLSDKGRFAAPVQINTKWPEELAFDSDADRALLRKWCALKDKADRALMAWSAINERRKALLDRHPELRSASII